jgi:hypothetical protein
MNQNLALRLLSELMGWDDEKARQEFAWLQLMARFKYDGYGDYLAGARFTESLVDWLQQFNVVDRETAYAFVRNRLVYISPMEMLHLVELTYPEFVQRCLVKDVATRLGILPYEIWAKPRSTELYRDLCRRTLFMGLSDGARIDVFRRANVGVLSNEQIVVATEISDSKWARLLKKLRAQTGDSSAGFRHLFLLDDFVASGTNLLRCDKGHWEGKLKRSWDEIENARRLDDHAFERDWMTHVHHYIGTHQADEALRQRNAQAAHEIEPARWFCNIEFTFGLTLPESLLISSERDPGMVSLVERYYDSAIETEHSDVGGKGLKLGFSGCALPLILDHNTPNNSLAILWAESREGAANHRMRPLFRRRQRHA